MSRNDKRKLSLMLILSVVIMLVVVGVSYAIYRANVTQINKTETKIQSMEMGLVYTGGNGEDGRTEIDAENVMPGDTFYKNFTVENITDKDLWYNIYMQDIENDYNEDLVYTLYETDETFENIIRTVVEETKMPDTNKVEGQEGKKTYIKTRIDIEAQPKKQYYKMVVTFKYRDTEQEVVTGKFDGTMGIDVAIVDESARYTLIINPNGGKYNNTTQNTTVSLEENAIYNLSTPTREGYTFTGWTSSVANVLDGNTLTMPAGNVTVMAQWEEAQAETYKLTINPNGGIYNSSPQNTVLDLAANATYNLLTPTKEGYTFTGWISNVDGVLNNNVVTMPESNVTITANWEQTQPTEYTLTINPNGGTYNNSTTSTTVSLAANATYNMLTPTREGYDFTGWTSSVDGVLENNVVTMPASNVTLTATWEESQAAEYTLTINPNGGIYNNSTDNTVETLHTGDTYTLETPTRQGFTFTGWSSVPTLALVGNTVTITLTDVEVTANWEPNVSPTDAVAMIQRTGVNYATIQAAEDEAITNDTIVVLKDTEEDFSNNKKVKLNLNRKTVTGKLSNTSSGDITIVDGVLENQDDYTIVNNGTIQLGENDGTISMDSVQIVDIDGTHDAIDQSGDMNFYDGFVEGKIAISGDVDDKPESNDVYIDHNTTKDCQKAYLIPVSEVETNGKGVAKTITNGTVIYQNLQDAINVSEVTGYDIYAIRNFEAAYPLSVSSGKNIKFDLDGFTVNTGYTITNNGTFTITNNKTTGNLQASIAMTNPGTLNLTSVNYTGNINNTGTINTSSATIVGQLNNTGTAKLNFDANTRINNSNNYAIVANTTEELVLTNVDLRGGIDSYGNLKIVSGTYDYGATYALHAYSGETVIEGGTFTSSSYYDSYPTIFVEGRGTLIINDGDISSTNGKAIHNEGSLTINDGDISAKSDVITGTYLSNVYLPDNTRMEKNFELNINGGNITSNEAVYGVNITNTPTTVNNGVVMTGGHISTNGTGMKLTSHDVIFGGTIEGEIGIYYPYPNVNRKLEITGGTIEGSLYGVQSDGTTYVTGGTIIGGTYGLYINNNTSGLINNIGVLGNGVSTTSPTIKGDSYGVYINSGTVYLYDGYLLGQTGGYSGTFAGLEPNYKLKTENNPTGYNGYIANYLEENTDFLEVNGATFSSINDAVEAASAGDTITVFKNGTITSDQTINKAVTIDLAGYTVDVSSLITITANATIEDSSANNSGKIVDRSTLGLISTNGTIAVNLNNVVIEPTQDIATTQSYVIKLNGKTTLNVNNCDIHSISRSNVIYGDTSQTVNLNNSTIALQTDGNSEAVDVGNVTVTGGVITNNDTGYRALSGKNITVNSGSINGIDLVKNGVLVINGGTITRNSAIYTYASTTVTINDGTINGNVSISSNSRANIYGGTITSTGIAISISGSSTVTLGTKDDNVPLSVPVVIGDTQGISNSSSTFNFYDGIIKSKDSTKVISGVVSDLPDGTHIANSTEGEYFVKTLADDDDICVVDTEPYNAINKAARAIETTGTIVLTADATIESATTFPSGKTITLDLNGHNLTFTTQITNSSRLTITDSSANPGTMFASGSFTFIQNNSHLTIDKVKISSNNINTNYAILTQSQNAASITLNDVTLENIPANSSDATRYVKLIKNTKGTLTLNNPTINSGFNHASIDNAGTIIANGGHNLSLIQSAGTTTINGGEFNSPMVQEIMVIINGGTLNMNGGLIESSRNTALQATCTTNSSCKSTVNMTGGTIRSTSAAVFADKTNFNLKGGNLSSSHELGSAISARTGSVLKVTGEYETLLQGYYGIYMSGGTVTVGLNTDGIVSTSKPVIEADGYAVYSTDTSKTIDFYDGILKAKDTIRNIDIAHIPNSYVLADEIDGEYNIEYLTPQFDVIENMTTEINYNNIQTAISAASDGDTLKLLSNVGVYYTITNDKDITLDLDSKKIDLARKMTNDGTLTITNGTISSSSVELLTNNETVTMNNVTLNNDGIQSYIFTNNKNATLTNVNINAISAINNSTNNSNLVLTNCTINASDAVGISNSGTYTITGGSINGQTYDIYDSSDNTNSITNATLSINNPESYISTNEINYSLYVGGEASTDLDSITLGGRVYTAANSSTTIDNNSVLKGMVWNRGTMDVSDSEFVLEDGLTIKEENYDSHYTFKNHGTATMDNVDFNITTPITYGRYYDDRYPDLIALNNHRYTAIINDGTMTFDDSNVYVNNNTNDTDVNGIQTRYEFECNNCNVELYSKRRATGMIISRNAELNNLDLHVTGNSQYAELVGIEASTSQSLDNHIDFKSGSILVDSAKMAYGVDSSPAFTMGEAESPSSPNYGTENANVSTTAPTIRAIGTTRGIGVAGGMSFYDGLIVGSYQAKPDTTSLVEYLYEATFGTEAGTGYETCYLRFLGND